MDIEAAEETKIPSKQEKRRRLRVGDPDFVPPDGGWGWLVVVACGLSNLFAFPMVQQYGLVFRDKFQLLGISETQTTTISNLTIAFNSVVGLSNGPVFRKYTYRQVGIFGSCLTVLSIIACIFCSSFWEYLFFFSFCYGAGFGLVQSANSLALNTYFKSKRRVATGMSWTVTAIGPIVWPYVVVALDIIYGMEGVVLIFSGLAMHALVGSLLLQPVEWHTEFKKEDPEIENLLDHKNNSKYQTDEPGNLSRISSIIFSSQYLNTAEDPLQAGYEITDSGTPIMIQDESGFLSRNGSKLSLHSYKENKQVPGQISIVRSRKNSLNLTNGNYEKNYNEKDKKLLHDNKPIIPEEEPYLENGNRPHHRHTKDSKENMYDNEPTKLTDLDQDSEDMQTTEKLSIWRKISIFFDFELFKDYVYVNIMVGVTLANFVEMNFSMLTPIIMTEFNFKSYEIATYMSLLGAIDTVLRFLIPFIADRIGWSNRTFFLIGILAMSFGRVLLIHTQTYPVALAVAVIIGAGKALRTIFIALVIPSHVPLEKLAAACGLQLAFTGILFVALGPLVGWIRHIAGNYVITLHILNIFNYILVASWILEGVIVKNGKEKDTTFVKNSSTKTLDS